MSEITNNILTWGSILAVFATVIGIAVSIGVYKNKVNTNTDNISKIFTKLDNISTKIERIPVIETLIKTFVDNFGSEKGIAYYKNDSPIELNKKGELISKDIDVKNILERLYDDLLSKVHEKKPDNPYDIQDACFEICHGIIQSDLLTTEEINTIKTYAYEIGEDVNGFHAIFALELRNMIFDREGHNIQDVDTHDPNYKK